jgi:hypothetical protein
VVDSHQVVLEVAAPDRTEVLRNLLGLYMHDLSDSFPIKLGADGRFVYENLSLYWSDPETRFPFLIHSGAELAGFALVTRGSPATDDPEHLDVAEFFVLRGHRRKGWAVKPHFFSGIDCQGNGSCASPLPIALACLSGPPLLRSTCAGSSRKSGAPEALRVGGCLPSRAPIWPYEPSNKRLQPTARRCHHEPPRLKRGR